jgi:hypothetical protein
MQHRRARIATMKALRPSPCVDIAATPAALARKADICAQVLAEARRLLRGGQSGSAFNQLVARARELLDDIDEILVALDPHDSKPGAALAAGLRREAETLALVILGRSSGADPGASEVR